MAVMQIKLNNYHKEEKKELEAFKRELITLIASMPLEALDLHQLAYKKDRLIIKGE